MGIKGKISGCKSAELNRNQTMETANTGVHATGREEKEGDFYNSNLTRMLMPLEESPWRRLYELAAVCLPFPPETVSVADLGCGTGRFAKVLYLRGYSKYWGVDFSEARVEEARRYVPDFEFEVGNLNLSQTRERMKHCNAHVVLEVLEHIDDDLGLLAEIPMGATAVLSVPNYDSAAHVRFFESLDAALKRYEGHFDFEGGFRIEIPITKTGKRIFLFTGVRA